MKHPNRATDIHWYPIAFSSSPVSATGQHYAQIEKETKAIVHALSNFDQLLFRKSGIIVHRDHKPLETIFKRPMASASRRLQSMILTFQRYSCSIEYRKGSFLHIADTVSRAPLPETTHGLSTLNWSTVWNLKKTTQKVQVSEMLLYKKLKLEPARILRRKPFAPLCRQDG